jgi:prepilin-type processing-associated H-X9-DG protein
MKGPTMGEGLLGLLLFLLFLPVIRAFVCIYRLRNPDATGRRGVTGEVLTSLGWFVVVGALIALIVAPYPKLNSPYGRQMVCSYHLRQIMTAMGSYHDKYGSFPPAYSVDRNGRPLHSWRVLLLPYLAQQGLYERVRLDEPWNSPHNREVFEGHEPADPAVPQMSYAFFCPEDKENLTDTNYVMLLGPRTISNGPNSVRLKDITDGHANRIVVVEVYDLGIPWYEPRDLRVDQMGFKINDPDYVGIASRHGRGANVGYADGNVSLLLDDADPRKVEAMINGGEVLRKWFGAP